jgi:hypothetical protein
MEIDNLPKVNLPNMIRLSKMTRLPKDINNLLKSYLSNDELNYYKNNWNLFDEKQVCEIAAIHGWLDLLIWARNNNYQWNEEICSYAAYHRHLEILKWVVLSGLWPKTKWL